MEEKESPMRKNIITVLLVFLVPIAAYLFMTHAGNEPVNVADAVTNKPQIIKFTSSMCLDCQEMNKIMKEVYPEFKDRIAMEEISVQDGKPSTDAKIKQYGVTLVPTIILINSAGQQVKRIEGAIPKDEMEKCLEELK